MDTLIFKGIKAETLIGVYAKEREALQPVLIDLELLFDSQKAIISDDVANTIDYKSLTDALCAFVSQQTFQLIESLAEHIALFILERYPICEISVCVQKPNILPTVESISIHIHRKSTQRDFYDHDTSEFANAHKN